MLTGDSVAAPATAQLNTNTVTSHADSLPLAFRHLSNRSQEAVPCGSRLKKKLCLGVGFILERTRRFAPSSLFSFFNNSSRITRQEFIHLCNREFRATKSICTALPSSGATISFVSALTSSCDADLLMAAAKVHPPSSEAACEEQGDP